MLDDKDWHADHVIQAKRLMKPITDHKMCAICHETFPATLTSGLLASVLTGGWEASFCLIFHLSTYHPSCMTTPKATGPQPLLMDYHQMEADKLPFTLLRPCHPSNWDGVTLLNFSLEPLPPKPLGYPQSHWASTTADGLPPNGG